MVCGWWFMVKNEGRSRFTRAHGCALYLYLVKMPDHVNRLRRSFFTMNHEP